MRDFPNRAPAPALSSVTYDAPRLHDAEIVQTNKYRGDPSPEIDAEWMKIGLDTNPIRLYDEDLRKLNKSNADDPMRPLHRIPDESGGGYLAMLEVFHLLHCLVSSRFDREIERALTIPGFPQKIHISRILSRVLGHTW